MTSYTMTKIRRDETGVGCNGDLNPLFVFISPHFSLLSHSPTMARRNVHQPCRLWAQGNRHYRDLKFLVAPCIAGSPHMIIHTGSIWWDSQGPHSAVTYASAISERAVEFFLFLSIKIKLKPTKNRPWSWEGITPLSSNHVSREALQAPPSPPRSLIYQKNPIYMFF